MEKNNEIKVLFSKKKGTQPPTFLNEKVMNRIRNFHESIDGYEMTPLVSLDSLAGKIGVKKLFVKDESFRFGLNAFKALGATYAVARILCDKLDKDIGKVDYQYFKTTEVHAKIKDIVFTTASDGNHGRALAWAATQLGCKAVIYLNKGTVKSRVDAVWAVGGEGFVTEFNYDDTVRFVNKIAAEKNWCFVQDTALEGYTDIPTWITQGYATMVVEAVEQMRAVGEEKPTHVFLQAGVGAMAGGVLGYLANKYFGQQPCVAIVEPLVAACYFESASAADGNPRFVTGDMETVMAGLACGEPSLITWPVIRDFADVYISCSDDITEDGMRLLASPIGNDTSIVSGESGAVGVGLVNYLMLDDANEAVRQQMGLDENSVVLVFSTEGDTDPIHYKEVIGNKS